MKIGRIHFGLADTRSPQQIQAESLRRLAKASEAINGWVRASSSCQKCRKREGTHNWVGEGGVLAMTHGMSQRWCEYCVVEAQLAHARKLSALIPALESRLLELGASSSSGDAVNQEG